MTFSLVFENESWNIYSGHVYEAFNKYLLMRKENLHNNFPNEMSTCGLCQNDTFFRFYYLENSHETEKYFLMKLHLFFAVEISSDLKR